MTPAEHRKHAAELVSSGHASLDTSAVVHALLSLSPAPTQAAAAPQKRWDLTRPAYVPDATGGRLSITPTQDKTGVVFNYDDDAWLIESPDTLRDLASLLTAHADRMETRP